jgi:hypothetical protein
MPSRRDLTDQMTIEKPSLVSQLAFSHRGHMYSVALHAAPGGGSNWSYIIENVQVTSKASPIHDEVDAIAAAMTAACEHIDQLTASPSAAQPASGG